MAKKKKKKAPENPHAKGAYFLCLSALLFLALYSFTYMEPKSNYLGYVGYLSALGAEALFGLGAYLIPLYLLWLGYGFLQKRFPKKEDHLYFFLLLSSSCMLLTVFAESYPWIAEKWGHKVISEVLSLSSPFPHTLIRFYLGGFPSYYLFADLPGIYLEKTLSPLGTSLIFFSLATVSFLLITKGMLFPLVKSWGTFIYRSIISLIVFLKKHKNSSPRLKKTIYKSPPPVREKKAVKKRLEEVFTPIKRASFPKGPKTQNPKDPPEKKPPALPKGEKLLPRARGNYQPPPIDLLSESKQKIDQPTLQKDLLAQAEVLEETLKSFGIDAKVGQIHSGPTITSFEVHPPIGVKVQKIKTLENDIALNMQAKSIRIVAPIPGKAAVGVEIPAIHPQEVSFQEMLQQYRQKKKMAIPILLGKAINGDWVFSDMTKMPHCLIAGATGSGKSVCINTIVMSILMNASPDEVKLLMIDPKKVELTQYSNLPHMIAPVITEPHGAYAALKWLVKEMQLRYEVLKQLGLRNIHAFNHRKKDAELESSLNIPIPEQMPFILTIIDEFADLMMVSSSDIETPIARIAQMARAVGIHMILATQRPSREVITGIIKANIPTRISFKVASRINSQIILDETGAESLLGNGDLLFSPPGSSTLIRAQGAYISDEDINQVIEKISEKNPPNYLIPSFDSFRSLESGVEGDTKGKDILYEKALTLVLASKSTSTTFLQRKLKIGYARAASLMDELEENGIIAAQEGSKPRRVLRNRAQDPSLESALEGLEDENA